MSMTVMLKVDPSSAGTEATSFATSGGFRCSTSFPSTVIDPLVGS